MCELALGELVRLVDGRLEQGSMPPLAGDAAPIGRIVTDSRQVEEGDVFWALAGPHHDGANFTDEAFARGAAGVVVAGRSVEPWAGRWAIEVDDGEWALWQLAAAVRRRFTGRVVAVTGSVGKTTTRQMIHTVLASRLIGTASPHNYNNHIGVPLSILGWDEADDYAVVELGASHRGEIDSLAGLCCPHIGVITCIGEAHLGEFGSQRAIAQSKAELLAALPEDGWAVLCGDDPWLRKLARHCRARIVWVGRSAECDVVATDVSSGSGELAFTVEGSRFHVPVWGRHHLTSALAAIAVGHIMEVTREDAEIALGQFQAPPQRCEVRQASGITIIDDTYNASPLAMRAALEVLRDFNAPGRRIVVCGDMQELGDGSPRWHYRLGEQVVTLCGADLLVACGQYSAEVARGARDAGMPLGRAICCSSTQQVLPHLLGQVEAGDVVLVKGSRRMALEQIVDALSQSPLKQAA